jgi:hypothetical protein
VFLSLSPCAENTEEDDVKCKARCREKETKGFKTKPEIWVVTLQQEKKRTNVLISISNKRKTKNKTALSAVHTGRTQTFFSFIHTKTTKQTHTYIHSSVHRRMQTRVPRNPTSFTSAQLLQHTSELVVSAQLMFFQWRWRDQLPCCCSSCSCSCSSMDCTTREEAHRKKISPATEENLF